jgi:hypothetical protein
LPKGKMQSLPMFSRFYRQVDPKSEVRPAVKKKYQIPEPMMRTSPGVISFNACGATSMTCDLVTDGKSSQNPHDLINQGWGVAFTVSQAPATTNTLAT